MLLLDVKVEKIDEVLEDSYVIKTTHFYGNKDQGDICATSSAGDEIQSVGVKDDELSTAIITVKGIWIASD